MKYRKKIFNMLVDGLNKMEFVLRVLRLCFINSTKGTFIVFCITQNTFLNNLDVKVRNINLFTVAFVRSISNAKVESVHKKYLT